MSEPETEEKTTRWPASRCPVCRSEAIVVAGYATGFCTTGLEFECQDCGLTMASPDADVAARAWQAAGGWLWGGLYPGRTERTPPEKGSDEKAGRYVHP